MSSGLIYLKTEWAGNDELYLGMGFLGDEDESHSPSRITFETISNEMILDGKFRMFVKAIEIK